MLGTSEFYPSFAGERMDFDRGYLKGELEGTEDFRDIIESYELVVHGDEFYGHQSLSGRHHFRATLKRRIVDSPPFMPFENH